MGRLVNEPITHLLLCVILFIWNTLLGLFFVNDKFGIINFSYGAIFLFIFIIPIVTKSFEDWTNFFIVFLTFSLPIFSFLMGVWLIEVHLNSNGITIFYFLILVLSFFLYLTFLIIHFQLYLHDYYRQFSFYGFTFKAFIVHISIISSVALMTWIIFTITVNEVQLLYLMNKEYDDEKIIKVSRGKASITDLNNDFTFFHYELENKQVLILPVSQSDLMEGFEVLDHATSVSKKKDSPIFVIHSGKEVLKIKVNNL